MQLILAIIKNEGYQLCRSFVLATMLALAACSSSEPIEQQSKIAASASQTAAMVVDAWAAGAVPSHYASATLQSTAETLANASRQMQSEDSPESPERHDVITAMGRLSAAATHAQVGVVAGNPRQVSHALQELRTAASDLAAAHARYSPPKS
ncbi:hypothetical protein [Mesorhizobium sophorae]|uniref:hypothetical protein n=1 Tax=Mesorhizobium sophorae TaxID=1300294 RepID=UPI000BA42FB1|nr:hypothetical protein [Mesorhizobium sophorae]